MSVTELKSENFEKYEEVMTDEDLEELSKLRNEYFIQYYD